MMESKYKFANGKILNIKYNDSLKIDEITFRTTEDGRVVAIDLDTGITTNKYINANGKEPNLNVLNKMREQNGLPKLSKSQWQQNVTHKIVLDIQAKAKQYGKSAIDLLPKNSKIEYNGIAYKKGTNGDWKPPVPNFPLEKSNIKVGKWLPPTVNVQENKNIVKGNLELKVSFNAWYDLQDGNSHEYVNALETWLDKQHIYNIDCKKTFEAIQGYTAKDFRALRTYETTGCYTESRIPKMYKTLLEYIDKAPKYEGTMYRGTTVSNDTLSQWKNGKFSMEGISSFDKNENIAKRFVQGKTNNDNHQKVILVANSGRHRATPIEHISASSGENEKEILVHPNAQFTLNKIEKHNDITYVYIDEQY